MTYEYDVTDADQFSTSTPLIEIVPERVRVLTTTQAVMKSYQVKMSNAKWNTSFRNLNFLVVQDDALLGLIALSTPVPQLGPRDAFLFPDGRKPGEMLRNYMDMSVCVGAQPLAWHWNVGKLLAMIAYTLGDYTKERYGDDLFGITTTSYHGAKKATQYTKVYRLLGETKGYGHAHIPDEVYKALVERAKADGFKRDPDLPIGHPFANRGDIESKTLPNSRWHERATFETNLAAGRSHLYYDRQNGKPLVRGDGSGFKMRTLTFLWKVYPDEKPPEGLKHGQLRGIYYHNAVPATERADVIQGWYERWGRPRYERTKDLESPYQDGLS